LVCRPRGPSLFPYTTLFRSAASVLSARFPALLEGLEHPLVISAGVCGALDPAVSCGSLILPETVIGPRGERYAAAVAHHRRHVRSEEHTSELQSLAYLVCRL